MAGQHTLTFTSTSFDQDVVQSDKPVLVDFWAEWCGPCKMLAPVIDELAAEYEGRVKVGKLDVDANQDLSARFTISSIPTVLLFQGGQIREKFVGLRGKKDFQNALNKLVGAK